MDNTHIPMRLPLDEGFLRRQCPYCERQFKVRIEHYDSPPDTNEHAEEDTQYFCPLCHEPAPANAWWTKEQLDYRYQLVNAAVSDQFHGILAGTLGQLNQPGSLFRVEISSGEMDEPRSLDEPHDMTRVYPPCHEPTPLKIPDDWHGDVACFECGVRYPVDVIHATRQGQSDE